ncbi:hypothetical protein U1Q18_038815 [Sarracenia purpurea var. burkii]
MSFRNDFSFHAFLLINEAPCLRASLQFKEESSQFHSHSQGIQKDPNSGSSSNETLGRFGNCNISEGNWVRFADGPYYYVNSSRCKVDDRQNCLEFGRSDTEFLRWRWKPDRCELPRFDAERFLELVRGKTMAFIGDSVGRNQLESLMCLLARVKCSLYHSYHG